MSMLLERLKMKIKFVIILLVCLGIKGVAQNKWTQKINFAKTAKIVGKVSTTAGKISKVAPGLVGSTARIISSTAQVISSTAQHADDNQRKQKEKAK